MVPILSLKLMIPASAVPGVKEKTAAIVKQAGTLVITKRPRRAMTVLLSPLFTG